MSCSSHKRWTSSSELPNALPKLIPTDSRAAVGCRAGQRAEIAVNQYGRNLTARPAKRSGHVPRSACGQIPKMAYDRSPDSGSILSRPAMLIPRPTVCLDRSQDRNFDPYDCQRSEHCVTHYLDGLLNVLLTRLDDSVFGLEQPHFSRWEGTAKGVGVGG